MQLSYNNVYAVYLLLSFCHGKTEPEIATKGSSNDMEKAVKTLLGERFLIVSRGVYAQPDYPQCVCSRLMSVSGLKYHHNLTYNDVDINVKPTFGKRVYRDTFYQVQRQNTELLFLVHAYIGNRPEDNKISGTFKVFYANKECFVAGSAPSGAKSNFVGKTAISPTGNPACLLWRRPHAREKHRRLCRAAFKKTCRNYGKYVFVFTRDACLKKFTKQSLPLGKMRTE
uniref:Lipocalin n=1 Tax=Rhipicephalus appendiculatus TaxID=34631 RepID=A0A131YGD8_RHIAP